MGGKFVKYISKISDENIIKCYSRYSTLAVATPTYSPLMNPFSDVTPRIWEGGVIVIANTDSRLICISFQTLLCVLYHDYNLYNCHY